MKENPSAARAIGYRETIAWLQGRLREDELAPAIVQNTRALVRKQLTWFRTQLPPHPVLAAGGLTLEALFPEAPAQPHENDHVGRDKQRHEEGRQHAEGQDLERAELPRMGEADPDGRGATSRGRPGRTYSR